MHFNVKQKRPRAAISTSLKYGSEVPERLKLLTYNIQAAIGTNNYLHYVTRSWRHVLPSTQGTQRLAHIGQVIEQYDLVALQEVDGGSLRSSFVNQVAYLADACGFDYWYQQLNRDFGKLGQFSNGILSRFVPFEVEDHKLPGIKGRGVIVAKFGSPQEPLVVIAVHLALSERGRYRQLDYIRELVQPYEHAIVMGDMNCRGDRIFDSPLKDTHLVQADVILPTFPSWRPAHNIDHIIVSPSLTIESVEVVDCTHSDHRPVAMEIGLPESLREGFYKVS